MTLVILVLGVSSPLVEILGNLWGFNKLDIEVDRIKRKQSYLEERLKYLENLRTTEELEVLVKAKRPYSPG